MAVLGLMLLFGLLPLRPAAASGAEPVEHDQPVTAALKLDSLSLPPLTLEDAIAIALEKNAYVLVARGEESMSRNNVNIGNAGLLPTIDAVSGAKWTNPGSGSYSSVESTTTMAEIRTTYTLFDGFGNITTFTRLKNAGALATLRTRQKIEDVVMDVVRAYYMAVNSVDNVQSYQQGVSISEDRLRRARLRAEYGQSNTREVFAAEVDANNDKVSLLNAQFEMEQAMRQLNVLLQAPISSRYALDDSVIVKPVASLDSLRSIAFKSNAAYLASGRDVRDAKLAMLIARSDEYPEIGLEAGYGLNSYATGYDVNLNNTSPGVSAGVTMSMPIFHGRQLAIKAENARIAWLNSQLTYEQASLQLDRDLADARHSWENSQQVLAYEKRNIKAARLNFRLTKELFTLGQVTSTTFREAQWNLINGEQRLSAARYDVRINELEILRLTGRLLVSSRTGK